MTDQNGQNECECADYSQILQHQRVPIKVIERAMRIVEEVAQSRNGMSLTELGHATHMPHPTVHRILQALVSRKWLIQDSTTKKYSIGIGMFRLGNSYLAQNPLEKIAEPVMTELRDITGQSVHLAVLDGGYSVYIAVLAVSSEIRVMSRVGDRKPLYCCATGKALLAFQPRDAVLAALKETGLKRFTERTITTIQDLLPELEKIREQGYSLDLGEHNIHIRGVGAPIKGTDSRVVAALSAGGPSFELGDGQLEELIEPVTIAAAKISEHLGYEKSREYERSR
ncbi:MAG: IclR family transcriptional regulator [Bacillota bacterium]